MPPGTNTSFNVETAQAKFSRFEVKFEITASDDDSLKLLSGSTEFRTIISLSSGASYVAVELLDNATADAAAIANVLHRLARTIEVEHAAAFEIGLT